MKKIYYKPGEASELKKIFISWIGKRAHVGNGTTQILQSIELIPKRSFNPFRRVKQLFRIKFIFENSQWLNAREFLLHNNIALSETGLFSENIKRKLN